jgi:uncharacterized RDD family membrane protein YckC
LINIIIFAKTPEQILVKPSKKWVNERFYKSHSVILHKSSIFVTGFFITDQPMEIEEILTGEKDNNPELEKEGRYPTFQQRFGGTMVDLLVFFAAAIAVAYLLKDLPEAYDYIRPVIFIFLTAVYEPVMYTLGGTLGHRAMKMRIRKQSDESKNINLFQAYIRYALKITCGSFSIFRWINRKKNLTLHDFVSGSIVVHAGKKHM